MADLRVKYKKIFDYCEKLTPGIEYHDNIFTGDINDFKVLLGDQFTVTRIGRPYSNSRVIIMRKEVLQEPKTGNL